MNDIRNICKKLCVAQLCLLYGYALQHKSEIPSGWFKGNRHWRMSRTANYSESQKIKEKGQKVEKTREDKEGNGEKGTQS